MLHGLGLSLPFSTVHCPAPFKPLPVISQPTTVAKESSRYRREDETETDGREISVLQHTTNCHEMYWSTISWNLVVCSKSDISSPYISVSSAHIFLEDSFVTVIVTNSQNMRIIRCVQSSNMLCIHSSESLQQRLTRPHSQNSQLIFSSSRERPPFWL